MLTVLRVRQVLLLLATTIFFSLVLASMPRPVSAAPEDVTALQTYCQSTHSYNLTDGRDAEIICLTGDQGNDLNDNQIDVLWNALTPEERSAQLAGDGCTMAYAGNPDLIQACQDLAAAVAAQAETCEELSHQNGFSFGWIVCSIINGVGGAIQGIFNWILGLDETTGQAQYCNLEVNLDGSSTSTGSSSCTSFDPTQVERTWSAFRTLANVFFVVAFLYAIYQVAFSGGNNAYLIRSMLPKLAAAVVLVQLSFFFSKFLIDVSNDLGRYVSEVFDWVFQGQDFDPGAILSGTEDTSFADYLINSSLIAIGVIAGLVSFATIATVVVTMLITVFVVLVARKMLILVAIVLAPLAAIAWIHPQTDGLAKSWWQIFSKLLLMYPLIILLIKSGELMARATSGTGDATEFDMARFVAFFAPFFLIPFTFRFAGGMIGQIAGFTNNAGKGVIDRGKGVDAKRKDYRREKAAAKYKSNQLNDKWSSPLTKAKAGILGSSLLYGKTGGKLFKAEKTSEAKNPKDKINLYNLQAEEADIKIQSFDIQQNRTPTVDANGNATKGTLLGEMMDPNTSYSRRAAITEAMLNRRDIPQLGQAFDAMAKAGKSGEVMKLVDKNIGTLQEVAPQYGAGLYTGTVDDSGIKPNWSAITSRTQDQVGSVHAKSVDQMLAHATTPAGQAQADELVSDLMTRYVQAKRTNSRLDTGVSSKLAEIARTGVIEMKDSGGNVISRAPVSLSHLPTQLLAEAKNLDDRFTGATSGGAGGTPTGGGGASPTNPNQASGPSAAASVIYKTSAGPRTVTPTGVTREAQGKTYIEVENDLGTKLSVLPEELFESPESTTPLSIDQIRNRSTVQPPTTEPQNPTDFSGDAPPPEGSK